MKKKLLLFVFMIIYFTASHVFAQNLILEYDGAQHEYTGSVYKLMVNDEYVESAMHPIIFNDYSLVPIREVFESMGATVKYLDMSQQIFIEYNNNFLRLKIGSSEAYLNAETLQIPGGISPKLIALAGGEAKTMVPARFVSESLGFLVDFDGVNGIIKINSPENEDLVTIHNFKCSMYDEDTVTLQIMANKEISQITNPVLTEANVLYFDIPNSVYTLPNSNEISTGAIRFLRLGQHDDTTRIALDIGDCKNYKVNLTGDKMNILISITALTEANANEPTNENLGDKIVVLDAGHGGSDPGAIGSTGGQSYNEKDINLDMTLAVRDILLENNVNVMLTRKGDTYPTLTERSEFANKNHAVIFVSIHSNSATSQSASGFEVYYSQLNNGNSTGLSSSQLARAVVNNIAKNVSIRNRGVKTADHVVTRSSLMPAVLVEIGFMSNPDELALMLTEDFRNSFAHGIADGILSVLSDANPPTTTIPIASTPLATNDTAKTETTDKSIEENITIPQDTPSPVSDTTDTVPSTTE